jgi:hypothetical protein
MWMQLGLANRVSDQALSQYVYGIASFQTCARDELPNELIGGFLVFARK